jgi:predicted  nucleic acid-binding Zn-ribbon protein
MVNDPEKQLYEDMADLTEKVPKLQNEIKSLKNRLTKLSNRIESLELMTFQDQISKLGDELRLIKTNLVAVSRVVAFSEIDNLQLHMQEAIRSTLPANEPKTIRLKEYISVENARAIEKNTNSPTPLDVLNAFRKECITCSDKYNLGAFVDKPY